MTTKYEVKPLFHLQHLSNINLGLVTSIKGISLLPFQLYGKLPFLTCQNLLAYFDKVGDSR